MPTLYLDGYHVEARLNGRRIAVTRLDEARQTIRTVQAPLWDLDRVVVIGKPYVTMAVFDQLAREGVPVSFLSGRGRWLGGLYPNTNGHALRRLRQYELARNEGFALSIAQTVVSVKLRNYRRVLQRLSANREETQLQEQLNVSNSLERLAQRSRTAVSVAELRGVEGQGTALYFGRLRAFFPAELPFAKRSRRPPLDGANALMSYAYTIVQGEIDAAVRAAGFDPCLGFLHEISYGRPSLSLDLLEPYRGPVCDLMVLQLLNHQVIKAEHFERHAKDGGVYLTGEARQDFFREYEHRMNRLFRAKRHLPHTSFRRSIRSQVESLARAMGQGEPLELFEMP